MKLSTMAYASILTLAAVAFAVDGAFATVNYNSSKSNSGNFTFDPTTDLGAAKQCTDGGGTVKAGPGKLNSCEMPAKLAPTGAPTAKTN
jgi:hypothetical protein